MSKSKRKFESAGEALSYLRKNVKGIEINEEHKTLKFKESLGIHTWGVVDFLCARSKDRDLGWSWSFA